MFQKIQELQNLKGKRVLVRVDFNVTLNEAGTVDQTEDWRIQRSLPTINLLREQGAKIILLSHIGRERDETLAPVVQYINQNLFINITFVPFLSSIEILPHIESMEDGDIVMIENLRQNEGEEENSEAFARDLAVLGDLYVNDAFAVSHRAHASIVGIPRLLPSYAGLLLQDEIEHLSFKEKKTPFLVILGGAKLETKMPLVEKYLDQADNVFVGGALANEVFKSQGFEIGKSLSGGYLVEQTVLGNKKLLYPSDVVVRSGNNDRVCLPNQVLPEEMIVDVGSLSLETIIAQTKNAQRILWNGPLGLPDSTLVDGTKKLIQVLSESNREVIVGGGDTVAVIQELGLIEKFSFVSTGGGAMLEFLEKGTLPGMEALQP